MSATCVITETSSTKFLESLKHGIQLDPLPPAQTRSTTVPHAPKRTVKLTKEETKQLLKNALRYFPEHLHATLAPEFLAELTNYGHVYMYRFMPKYKLKAYPISAYPAKTTIGRAIQLMIMNNLDDSVAQFPQELITYGGNGSVLSNWAQYHLLMKYLSDLTEDQTLVMYSGHPVGLFPSNRHSPRVVITNGMVIPNFSTQLDYDRMYAMGVSMFGQMTAGSYCYIGPQGIVHGTTITILNAARKYLGSPDLSGKVFVSAGLGGMSGAQAKAGVIAGCVAVIAEVDPRAVKKRYEQGWVQQHTDDLDTCMKMIENARKAKKATSIAYCGNVVDLLEKFVKEGTKIELGSDQTSLHNPFNGGYYPAGMSFDEANKMMAENPNGFKEAVKASLKRHVNAVNTLCKDGMKFWDYGNSFLYQASLAGADIMQPGEDAKFKYPSYVEDIMGDIFSLGFGPFRWICTSGDPDDLRLTDKIAAEVCRELHDKSDPRQQQQYKDNLLWVTEAEKHNIVVGSQARILYSDCKGRVEIAKRFNKAVRDGKLKAPVVISRDHHDVSGTDSPFRETSNITDGSKFCADMAVQNCIGDAMRGADWVALHNGGGTGWGLAMNGGFGLVLDGSDSALDRATQMLFWDVNNGVARRAWSGNDNAEFACKKAMESNPKLRVTIPTWAKNDLLDDLLK